MSVESSFAALVHCFLLEAALGVVLYKQQLQVGAVIVLYPAPHPAVLILLAVRLPLIYALTHFTDGVRPFALLT